MAVSVAGTPLIQGAKTVAVNAFRRYDDAPLAAAPDVTGKRPQEITQGYLDGIDGENQTYMNAALANPAVAARLAGLGAYKLRPGVEVVSATLDGDLTVSGDIDLSTTATARAPTASRPRAAWRTRRAGAARRRQPEYLRQHQRRLRAAAGVAGRRRLAAGPGPSRLAGHHGFWRRPGGADRRRQAGGRHDVPTGSKLNYDLPVAPVTLPAGTVLPVAMTLDAALSLPAGLVLTGDVTAADGRVLRAGTVLAGELKLAPGAQLGAGFVLRGEAAVRAFTWPGRAAAGRLEGQCADHAGAGLADPVADQAGAAGRQAGGPAAQGAGRQAGPQLGAGAHAGNAGASAWTLTAVAGADLGSADVRTRNVLSKGDLVMSDTHYGLAGRGTRPQDHLCRRDGADAAGAEELIGDPSLAGKPIKPIADEWQLDWETMCSWGAYCEPEPRRVTAAGSQQWAGNASWVGKTVQEMAAALNKTEDAICANAAHCEGGGTSETIITRTYKYVFGSPLFSVLRTGAGDLSLLAGRDVGMASLYGVYTAGTPHLAGRGRRASTWRAAMTARPACWA